MSEYVLTSEELDTAQSALLRILEQPVDQIELTDFQTNNKRLST